MAGMDLGEFTLFRPDAILQRRDIRTTFSSWDNCMAKSYCKWPVIVGIIIGGLILIGALWSIIACACCGYTCCKSCCACCSCCCPSSSRDKSRNRAKYADEHSTYTNQNRRLSTGYQPPPAPPVYDSHRSNPAKFAQFDTAHSRAKANDDALPQMPTWDSAPTRRIEDPSPSHDVEMNRLDPATGQSFNPQSFSRPMRHNNNNMGDGGNNYYEGTPTSPAYPPAFDGYRGTEATSNIARTPSPGNPFGHVGAVGVATSHPVPRSPSPGHMNHYPPYTEVPTTTTSIMPNAITIHTTMPPPPTNPIELPRQYPPTPVSHSPSPPVSRSYSPYPPSQPVPQLQHLRQHSPTQLHSQPHAHSPTHHSPRYQNQNQSYTAYSPHSVPNTPPPPCSSTLGGYDQVLPGAQHGQPPQEQGPPSVLQPGRAPGGQKSWRDV
ncbi:hypothetical protein BDFG_07079 [Blastomyces dermatitidis ATCC 26199]|nr:hypothetical protein BDFG_07079 [Blastomyces dermatitidis ATCC 26199]